MNDAETRMIMVEHRVKVLCRKQDMRLTAMLTILCLTLTVSLIGVTSALVAGGKGHIPGLYGSTMLLEDAGGYVLTGVLAFSSAVVITVLCIRNREKKCKND